MAWLSRQYCFFNSLPKIFAKIEFDYSLGLLYYNDWCAEQSIEHNHNKRNEETKTEYRIYVIRLMVAYSMEREVDDFIVD